MNASIVIASIAAIAFVYLLSKLWRALRSNQKLIAAISSSKSLNHNSAVGSYATFCGKVSHPQLNSLFENHPSSWWQSSVNAVFETKAKKPSSGKITHKPKIFEASSNDQPLMLRNKQHLVLALFENLNTILVNPSSSNKTQTHSPHPDIETKAKYQHYEVQEYWLPDNTPVTLLGTVIANENNLITISGAKNDPRPALLFQGTEVELLSNYKKRSSRTKWMMVLILVFLAFFYSAMTKAEEFGPAIGAFVALAFFIYCRIQCRSWKL